MTAPAIAAPASAEPSAPPAPAPAAAAPPAPPAAPPAAPQAPLTVREAAQARRDALANGAPPIIPPAAEAPPAEPAVPAVADPAAPVDPTAAPAPEAAPTTPEGEPAPEGEPPAPDAGAGEPLMLDVPGRRPGEVARQVAVADPETAEHLQRVFNGYKSGVQLEAERTAVLQQREAVESLVEAADVDPVGFMMQRMENPVIAARVAAQILAMPGMLDQAMQIRGQSMSLAQVLDHLLDDQRAPILTANLELDGRDLKEQLAQQRAERVAGQQNAKQVQGVVQRLIPPEWPAERREMFTKDAHQAIAQYARANNVGRLDPQVLPILLAERMKVYGINPVEAAMRLHSPDGPPAAAPGSPPAPAARPAVPAKPAAPAPLKLTGKELKAVDARRQSLASIPGAGAHTPPATPVAPPKGSLLKEAGQFARKVFNR